MEGLSWEQSEPGFWLIYSSGADRKLLGEIYPRGKGYRWHSKLSDWRQMEGSMKDAKKNLLADIVKELARPDWRETYRKYYGGV